MARFPHQSTVNPLVDETPASIIAVSVTVAGPLPSSSSSYVHFGNKKRERRFEDEESEGNFRKDDRL